jgi:Protein of unknown function (DUF2846)
MTFARPAFLAFALLFLAACATVPKAPPERDLAAKQFAAPARGKAALYVFRNESLGSAVRMSLLLDGAVLGDTAAKTFHWVNLAPGKHTLVGKAENESVLEFTAAPGQNLFVWQEVKMGFGSARNQLELVDEERGRAGVAECELAEAGAIVR